jgi:hypothetical protein
LKYYYAPFAATLITTPPNTTTNDLLICLSKDGLYLNPHFKRTRENPYPYSLPEEVHQQKLMQELHCLVLTERCYAEVCSRGGTCLFKNALGKLFSLEKVSFILRRFVLGEQFKLGKFESVSVRLPKRS